MCDVIHCEVFMMYPLGHHLLGNNDLINISFRLSLTLFFYLGKCVFLTMSLLTVTFDPSAPRGNHLEIQLHLIIPPRLMEICPWAVELF